MANLTVTFLSGKSIYKAVSLHRFVKELTSTICVINSTRPLSFRIFPLKGLLVVTITSGSFAAMMIPINTAHRIRRYMMIRDKSNERKGATD